MNRFEPTHIKLIDAARSLGVRSGSTHKYTHVWVVVVQGRVLVRSWNDKATGWYRAFLREPVGSIRVGKKEIPARGARVRSARLLNAVSTAIATKYPHKGSQQYVLVFRTPKRKATTLEFLPTSA
jgi:hypothetical protein